MDQVAEAIALVIKGGEEQVPAARAIIQKLTDKYIGKVDAAVEEKSKEILKKYLTNRKEYDII